MPLRLALLLPLALAGCSSQPAERVVEIHVEYAVRSEPGTRGLTVTLQLPVDLPGAQRVRTLRVTPEPRRVFEEGGGRYAELFFDEGPDLVRIQLAAVIELWDDRFAAEVGEPSKLPDAERARCLAAEPHLERDAPEVQAIAARLSGDSELERLRSGYRLVCAALAPEDIADEARGALATVRRGGGDCSDYSDLLAAVYRAGGIPARVVTGLHDLRRTAHHAWVEVWSDEGGWIALDPLQGDLGEADFGAAPGSYVAFTTLRNDPRLGPFFYYGFACEAGGASVGWSYRLELSPSSPLSR
ncbi:MAG: transglutaminase domain-containing protein [Planctomycetota bacterium]